MDENDKKILNKIAGIMLLLQSNDNEKDIYDETNYYLLNFTDEQKVNELTKLIFMDRKYYNINLRANIGYWYGMISFFVKYGLIIITNNCGYDCKKLIDENKPESKQYLKECSEIIFGRADTSFKDYGSKSFNFRNISFINIKYKYNIKMIVSLIIKIFGNISNELINKYIKNMIDILNVFIMSMNTNIFGKITIETALSDKTMMDLGLTEKNMIEKKLIELSMNEMINYKGDWEHKNENNKYTFIFQEYARNFLYENELYFYNFFNKLVFEGVSPNIITILTNYECDFNNTMLNNTLLKCGKLNECFNDTKNMNEIEYKKYKILMTEHISKHSTTLTDFINDSWREDITEKDIFGIVIQIVYNLFILNYNLGILHNDLHTDNIFIEDYWRSRSFAYVIILNDILKDIFFDKTIKPENDIFKECREKEKNRYWEINNDGLKGVIIIQTKKCVKIYDFDKSEIAYGNKTEDELKYLTNLIKTKYNKISSSIQQNVNDIINTNNISTNKYHLFRNIDIGYSIRLKEKYNNQINDENINYKKSTLYITRTSPINAGTYDIATLFGCIYVYIYKVLNIDEVKKNKIINKWKDVLRYILNDDIDILHNKDLLTQRGRINYNYRNLLALKCKTPVEILFNIFTNDIKVGNNKIEDYTANKKHKTHSGLSETKIYAQHYKQFNEQLKLDGMTSFYIPPFINNETKNNLYHLFYDKTNMNEKQKILMTPQLINDNDIEQLKMNIKNEIGEQKIYTQN